MANQRQEQQEYNATLTEAKKLLRDINRLRAQLNQTPLQMGDEEAVNGIQSLRNEFKSLASEIGNAEGTATNLFQQMVGIAKEFGAVLTPAKQLKSAFSGMVAEATKLKNDELGLIDLRTRDLQKMQEKMRIQNEAARTAAEEFSSQRAHYDRARELQEKELEVRREILAVEEELAQLKAQGLGDGTAAIIREEKLAKLRAREAGIARDRIDAQSKVSDEANAAFQYLDDQDSTYDRIQGKITKRLQTEREISRLTGVTGALVEGTGALMERLGMRSGIFHDAMKDASEEMRQMAKDTAEGNANFNKLQIAAKGFYVLAKGFGAALGDPAAIAGALLNAFFDVNKAAVEFTRLTGQASSKLAGMTTEGSNLVDVMNTAAEITKQTGLNAAAIFSPQQLGQLSDAKNLLGISAEQASNLGMMMKLTDKSADQLGESIYDNVDAGISQKMVYDDVLSASEDIVASAGGNTEELGRAASAARKLGLDLAKVNQIADGLLDFESSISAELEAQLLTGKNINLSKARELALNNDLEGVARELEKNGASAAEYAKMNRIQQESLAKALGMSRQELGKMVLTEEALADMTEKERAAARGVTLEQSKQMDIQMRLQKSISALAQAFAPILENFIVPIAETISYIVQSVTGLVGLFTGATEQLSAMQIVLGSILSIYLAIRGIVAAIQIYEGIVLGYKSLQNIQNKRALYLEQRSLVKSVGMAVMGVIQSLSKIPVIGWALGLGAAATVAGIAAAYMNDGAIAPVSGGKDGYSRTMFGPEGSISFNDKDTIVAGTNLFGKESGGSTPPPATVDTRALEAKLDKLIAAVTAGGDVYLDGNKVGQAQVLGTYKSS